MIAYLLSTARRFVGIVSAQLACLSGLQAQSAAFQGSLADYLSLGEAGVSIGRTVFSNFQLLPRQVGASGFQADLIGIVPLSDDPAKPGFRFEIMDGASAEDFFELTFSFRVSGAYFQGATLSLGSVSVRSNSNAGVDVLAELSGRGDKAGSLARLVVFAAPEGINDLLTAASFIPSKDFAVELDSIIDGGGEGRPGEITASIGSATLRFQASLPAIDFPLRVSRVGLVNPKGFFIEFVSGPMTRHVVKASATPADGFPTPVIFSTGDGITDASGFERVEFDVSSFPSRQFFRVEKSS